MSVDRREALGRRRRAGNHGSRTEKRSRCRDQGAPAGRPWPRGGGLLILSVIAAVSLMACDSRGPESAARAGVDPPAGWVEYTLGPSPAIDATRPVVLLAPGSLRPVRTGTFPVAPALSLTLEGRDMRLRISLEALDQLPQLPRASPDWQKESLATPTAKGWLTWRRERAEEPPRDGWHVVGAIELVQGQGALIQGWVSEPSLPTIRQVASSIHVRD